MDSWFTPKPPGSAETKHSWGFTRPEWMTPSPAPTTMLGPVGPEELIAPDGHCADEGGSAQALHFTAGPDVTNPAGAAAAPPPGPRPALAPLSRGIALGMTECDVVRTAGHTDNVQISANERGDRVVTMTYLQGERPGIYRFVSGRLAYEERVAEPPPPPKPAKPKKTAKKKPTDS